MDLLPLAETDCVMQRVKFTFIVDSENVVCVLVSSHGAIVSSLQGHSKWSVFILCMLLFKKF